MIQAVYTIFRRELGAYFAAPLAWIFLLMFAFLAVVLSFFVGDLFGRGQADLKPFFNVLPWLLLFFVPAVSMRLWAEERQTGNIELLLTLPVRTGQLVAGKFFAAWSFVGLALVMTVSLWLTVEFLGEPDNATVGLAYLSAWLLAGAMLAVGSLLSAVTRSQVLAFVLTVPVLFLLLLPGLMETIGANSLVSGRLGMWLELWRSLALVRSYRQMTEGLFSIADVLFFIGTMVIFLAATVSMLEWKKAHAS